MPQLYWKSAATARKKCISLGIPNVLTHPFPIATHVKSTRTPCRDEDVDGESWDGEKSAVGDGLRRR